MSDYKKDLFSGIFFLLFAGMLYLGSFSIIATTSDAMGPQFFPRVTSLFFAILSVIQIYKCMRNKEAKTKEITKGEVNKKAIATIVILFLYALLISYLGFIITTAAYLFCQIFLLLSAEEVKVRKNQIFMISISVISPIVIYYLFYYAFSIFLPAGILG